MCIYSFRTHIQVKSHAQRYVPTMEANDDFEEYESEIRSWIEKTKDGKAAVQNAQQMLLGKKDAYLVIKEISDVDPEKLDKRKVEALAGRNVGGAEPVKFTSADMTEHAFRKHRVIIFEAGEGIQREQRPDSIPRLQSVDMEEASMLKVKSLFFNEDGSLQNSRKNDIKEFSDINFQNELYSGKLAKDKRLQLHFKLHDTGK